MFTVRSDIPYGCASDERVRELQVALARVYPLPRSLGSDGVYDGVMGPETWAVVDAWCISNGIPWDAQRCRLSIELLNTIVGAKKPKSKKRKKGS